MITIGLVFTLTLITYTFAQPATVANADDITVATCVFDANNFLMFAGNIEVDIDATAKKVAAKGKVQNNPAKRWAPNQSHGVQVRQNSDISGNACANVGDVLEDWGNAITDDQANLVFDFNVNSQNADKAKIGGRSLVILRNDSSVVGNANAIVACCVITLAANTPVWTAATQPAVTAAATVAWNYPWPQGWTPPPGCNYIPAAYVEYVKTTTTTTTTTTYNYATTAAPPPPPPPATQYDPYAPPPPPTTTAYYLPTTTTTKATTAAYCWNCPMPDSYGNPPPYNAYAYQQCAPAATTGTACVPSYYVKCPASQSVLALFAALVALFALLF